MNNKQLLEHLKRHVSFEIVEVTPAQAQGYLRNMAPNRRISDRMTAGLASEIAGGYWTFTGECLIFNHEGKLIDGQHRCKAIVETGVSVVIGVIRGVPSSNTIFGLNTGRRRTGGDVLTMRGSAHGTLKAAIARCFIDISAIQAHELTLLGFGRRRLPLQEVVRFADKHGELLDTAISIIGRQAWHTPALFCALFLHLAAIDRDKATTFFRILMGEEGAPGSRVIVALREKLNRVSPNQKSSIRARATDFVPLVFRAWNTWLAGTKGPFDDLLSLRDRVWPELSRPSKRKA